LMAHQIIEDLGGDSRRLGKLTDAIAQASNHACENVFLPGLTVVMADNSGSMSSQISAKSQMTCAGAANSLCGIVAKASDDAYVISFGQTMKEVRFSKNTDTVVGIARAVAGANVGHSTNAHLGIAWMIKNNIVPDRVILLSDMQCWDSDGGWYSDGSVCDAWAKYKKVSKGASKTWFHSVHINGYGDNPIDAKSDKVNLVSGFSEKIIPMLLESEGTVAGASEEAQALPTVEQIRQKWSVS